MPHLSELYHLIIRVSKEESSFVYFILEANEGLAFYSTLDHTEGDAHRDVDISTSISFRQDLDYLINKLQQSFSIQILTQEIISDQ